MQFMTLKTRSTLQFSHLFRVVLTTTRLVLWLLHWNRPRALGSRPMLSKSRPMQLPLETTWWARDTSLLLKAPRTTLFCGILGPLGWQVKNWIVKFLGHACWFNLMWNLILQIMFFQATRLKNYVTLQTSLWTRMPCLVTAVLWHLVEWESVRTYPTDALSR